MSKENTKKGVSIGTGFVTGVSVIYILLGLAMLFVPQFKETYIIYIAGAVLVIYGVILIVKYFMTGSYRDIGKYGFSIGVLSILIGICMFIRSVQISAYFSLFLGACILLTSVIKLQNAVDLKSIHNGTWFLFLIIAVAFLAVSIAIVLDPLGKVSAHADYIYYVLVADGAVNIISTLFLAIAIRTSRKKEAKAPGKEPLSAESEQKPALEPEKQGSGVAEKQKRRRETEEDISKTPENGDPDLLTVDSDETIEDILRVFEEQE